MDENENEESAWAIVISSVWVGDNDVNLSLRWGLNSFCIYWKESKERHKWAINMLSLSNYILASPYQNVSKLLSVFNWYLFLVTFNAVEHTRTTQCSALAGYSHHCCVHMNPHEHGPQAITFAMCILYLQWLLHFTTTYWPLVCVKPMPT